MSDEALMPGTPPPHLDEAGRAYRRVVFGSGGHAVGMRRLLAAVRRASERPG
ncbi:hypothetical protein [Streptomyces cyaneofuscatus]|uniref:hypothetical protein n=1 Tax=Streptomyces cyaneofuscatus TaxID=66883 RepID=UPI003815FD4C